jgi:hypothetical protein
LAATRGFVDDLEAIAALELVMASVDGDTSADHRDESYKQAPSDPTKGVSHADTFRDLSNHS